MGAGLRVLLAGVLLVGLSGCLFDPRQPEGNVGTACFVADAAVTPDQVLINLDGSLECLLASTYIRQVSPEFVFIAAPSVQASYPDLFPFEGAWGQGREAQFIDTLSGDVESQLLLREIKRSGTSEVQIEAEYRVVVSADGSRIEYTGEAFYTFRQEQTVWVMIRWEEKEAASPLGALKAALVSGR
jgi:hypothetical protein